MQIQKNVVRLFVIGALAIRINKKRLTRARRKVIGSTDWPIKTNMRNINKILGGVTRGSIFLVMLKAAQKEQVFLSQLL
jgi:hypothetical protein